jgi:hypothetical protein
MQDWAEEHLLIPALSWAQERRMGAVLRSFSPTLTHRSDGARGIKTAGPGSVMERRSFFLLGNSW